mmetsp:Transcript_124880/g.399239  ORF Transcript_124880/g.399239 Transcript_124880/m.399239 type:complete len:215 (+) Transcript_124880:147-791(+)
MGFGRGRQKVQASLPVGCEQRGYIGALLKRPVQTGRELVSRVHECARAARCVGCSHDVLPRKTRRPRLCDLWREAQRLGFASRQRPQPTGLQVELERLMVGCAGAGRSTAATSFRCFSRVPGLLGVHKRRGAVPLWPHHVQGLRWTDRACGMPIVPPAGHRCNPGPLPGLTACASSTRPVRVSLGSCGAEARHIECEVIHLAVLDVASHYQVAA